MSKKATRSPETTASRLAKPNLTDSQEADLHALIQHLFYLEGETKRHGLTIAANLIGAAAEQLTDELMDGASFTIHQDRLGTKVTLPH